MGMSKRIKRVLAYRLITEPSGILITYWLTGKMDVSILVTVFFILAHSTLHYVVDRLIK